MPITATDDVNDSWDDPTESIMGAFDDRSLEIDVDFAALPPTRSADEMSADGALAELWPDASRRGVDQPDLVIFDPMAFGLSDQLARLGYRTREAHSGVDVMTLVAARPTGAVICGPAEDAERRRLLTAALRLRFPAIPVIYISTHARNPAAVKGAKAEGAEVVVPLPLPSPAEIEEAIGRFSRPLPVPAPVVATPLPDPVGHDDDNETATVTLSPGEMLRAYGAPAPLRVGGAAPTSFPAGLPPTAHFEDVRTAAGAPAARGGGAPMTLPIPAPASLQGFGQLPPSGVHSAASAARVHAPEELRARRELPTEVVTPVRHMPDQTRERSVEAEAVSFEGGPKTNPEMNGEVGQLLSAISPFLWGLEDASAYMDRLAQGGEPMAVTHARTLKLLAKLLTQLKNRVDDLGL